jgi:peroxiredoxin
MKSFRRSLVCLLLASCPAAAAPADAQRVEKTYQLSMEKWALEVRIATTPEARAAAWEKRPDPAAAAREMWKIIGRSLQQEWTLEPAAWFIQITADLSAPGPDGGFAPLFAAELTEVRDAIAKHHLASPALAPVCLALANTPDPHVLNLLEKIQKENPEPKIQGVAALANAIVLKTLSDDPEVMRQRLTLLRKAIIQSADAEIDGLSVAKLAEDELYVIRFLTKGRVAPDLAGADSGGRQLKLSDHQGKVVILVFWNSELNEAGRLIEMTSELHQKYRGRPLVVVGVNNDPTARLRSLQADGTVDWINFSDPLNQLSAQYRVGSWPLTYVLDHERKIQYAGPPGSFAELTADALLEDIAKAAGN